MPFQLNDVSTKQRYLRRMWLLDNIELLLREAAYHRANALDMRRDGITVWNLDAPEGSALIN